MKPLLIYTLLLLVCLVVNCKTKTEEVDPLASIYPPGCQIVRTVYKTPTIGFPSELIVEPEDLQLNDGKTVKIGTVEKSTYLYNGQGQITEIVGQHLQNTKRRRVFLYSPNLLLINEIYSSEKGLVYERNDTVPLNNSGYQDRATIDTNPQLNWIYDSQGYFLGRSPDLAKLLPNRYEQGNLVRFIDMAYISQQNGQVSIKEDRTRVFKYDLNRANLPPIYQYLGRPSRNLPVEEVIEIHNDAAIAEGPVYRKTFTYTFDTKGRILRRVAYGRRLNSSWLLEDDLYGVGVTDYEYANCP